MSWTSRVAGWVCLLWIWGCSSSSDGSDPAGGAGDGSSGGGSSAMTGSGGNNAGGSGSGGSGTGSGSGSGGEPAQAGAGGSSGGSCGASTGERPAPPTPTLQCNSIGGICGGCLQEKCCDLVPLCAMDADCACMAMCTGTQSLSGVEGCLVTCGVTGSPPGYAELAQCLATTCPDSDECSVPAAFTPPPDVAPSGGSSSMGIGSGALADCSFDPSLRYDENGPILQLESADKSVCVRIERRDDGPGSLANTNFTLLSMRVGPPGEVALVDDPTAICWYSSHHNFNDWAHAWSGSRHYDLKMARADHGIAPTYALHVFEGGPLSGGMCPPAADGDCPIGSAIELFPAP